MNRTFGTIIRDEGGGASLLTAEDAAALLAEHERETESVKLPSGAQMDLSEEKHDETHAQ